MRSSTTPAIGPEIRLDGGDVLVALLSRCFEIEAGLQAEPKLGRGAQIARQTQCRVRGHRGLFSHQALDARSRYAQLRSEGVGAHRERLQDFLAQDFAGMHGAEGIASHR
jgi:hypothetical protein